MLYVYPSGDNIRQRLRLIYSAFRYESGDNLRLANEAYELLIAMGTIDYYTGNLETLREKRIFNGKRKIFDALVRLDIRLTEAVTKAAWARGEYDSHFSYLRVGLPTNAPDMLTLIDGMIPLGIGAHRSQTAVPEGYVSSDATANAGYLDMAELFETIQSNNPDLVFAEEGAEQEEHLRLRRVIRLQVPEAPTALHARMMRDYGYADRYRIRVSGFNARGERLVAPATNRRGWEMVSGPSSSIYGGHTLFTPYDGYVALPTNARVERDFQQWRRDRIATIRANGGLYNPPPTPAASQPVPVAVAAEKYTNARAKRKHTEIMHIPTLPVPPEGTAASRTWGIEVETGAGRHITQIPENWDRHGDGSLRSAYDEETYVDPSNCTEYQHNDPEEDDYWDLDEDPCDYCGIVNEGDGGQSGDCVEIVSPILTSFHTEGLRSLTNDLEPHRVSQSAGLHVHVGADGLTAGQIRELLLGYDAIEWLIEASYKRVSRGYCKRRSARELLEIARRAKAEPKAEPRNLPTGDRYVTVNLQSLSRHGTIEFRAMGPVYNYDHLVRWAMFCREMVNSVHRGARAKDFAKVREWADVLAIFQRYGIEYNDALNAEISSELTTAEVVAS